MPENARPLLGHWTFTRQDDEQYHIVLQTQGLPWAIRKLLQVFVAEREFVLEADGRLLFRSKMLTGSWNELHVDTPSTFSVLGYTIEAVLTWEDDGRTLVSTTKTTAADGYFSSGWTATTRMTHTMVGTELEITTIAPEGQYKYWMSKDEAK